MLEDHAAREPAEVPGRFGVFAHLTTDGVDVYRRIMDAFVTAKERFQVHLRPEDVNSELLADGGPGVELTDLAGKLDSLERWGNLRSDPDTSRVTAVEDFYRRRLLYQLTHPGEAAERAMRTYDDALGRRGALQAVALADIELGLRELLVLAEAGKPDLGKLRNTLNGLTARFTDLADNASAFMSSLQRSIDLQGASEDAFVAYKDKLIEYLERFIQDLVTVGASIAGLIRGADGERVDHLLGLVAAEEAADEAPDPDDPEAALARKHAHERWRNRWSGLVNWFVSADGRDSQARLLRTRALALDAGTPLGALAASAAAAIQKPVAARPGSAAWRREVWASLGILVDDLSSTVLVLGLPGSMGWPTAQALAAFGTAGQPAVLTLRQLVSDGVGAAPAQVSVCENPAVVAAAADRLGPECSPLVCLQGQPGTAALTLLTQLRKNGTSIRYHGDFDWGGVTIARTLATHVDWRPWRFGAVDYLAAVGRYGERSLAQPDDVTGNSRSDRLPKLAGPPLDTPWDPALSVALAERGVRIEEELVLDDLVADLAPF